MVRTWISPLLLAEPRWVMTGKVATFFNHFKSGTARYMEDAVR